MQRLTPIAAAFALAFCFTPTVWAADSLNNEALRDEVRALQQQMQALEIRLKQAEAQPAAPAATALSADNAFNPAIAAILTGTYSNLSQDPTTYRLQGFLPAGDEMGPGSRSFSLGESELTFSANADHLFKGTLTFSLTAEGTAEVEEAKLESLALPGGTNVVAGRFLSNIGYLNNQHSHTWDFVDLPLAYQAFYGGQYKNDGLQLRWLAPMDSYFELGAELGNGQPYPGNSSNHNGAGAVSGFMRLGNDIGQFASWQANLWYQHTKAEQRAYTDQNAAGTDVSNTFSGSSNTWGLAAVGKWNPAGNTYRQLKLVGEFLQRKERGELAYDTTAAGGAQVGSYDSRQFGWYLQASYRFLDSWRLNLRHDQLDSGSPQIGLVDSGALSQDDFAMLASYKPKRDGLSLDYQPSEFSRLRLQYNRDNTQPNRIDNQVFVQYTLSLGAHGAHSY